MAEYIIYDFINDDEIKEYCDSLKTLITRTNEFYYNTFIYEDDYDENKVFRTLKECIELWEGSGFGVARILKDKED